MIRISKIFFRLILLIVIPCHLFSQIDKSAPEDKHYEGFFQIYYAGVLAEDIIVYIKDSSVYIPLSQTLSLLKVYHEVDYYNRSLKGYFINRDSVLLIDFGNHRAKVASKEQAIPEDLFLATQFEYYVLPEFFHRIFGIKFEVSILELLIRVESNVELPILSEYKRKRQYRFLEGNGELNYEPLMYDRSRSLFRMGLLDYRLDYLNYLGDPSYAFGSNLGIEILGGDLSLFYAGSYNRSYGYRDINPSYQWRYFLNENSFFTQFIAGQLSNSGYRMSNLPSINFKGFQISNEFAHQPVFFSDFIIEDIVEPGWQIELYRNGALFDQTVSDAVGRYRFVVPVQYGNSNLELRIYGTKGEYFIKKELINIPTEFLQPGDVKYTISSGERSSDSIWFSEFRAYAGITKWLTLNTILTRLESDKKLDFGARVSIKPLYTLHLNFDLFPEKVYRTSMNYWNSDVGSIELQYSDYRGISEFNPFGALKQLRFMGSLHSILSLPINLTFSGSRSEQNISYINRLVSNLFVNLYPFSFRFRYGADYLENKNSDQNFFMHTVSGDVSYSLNRMPFFQSVLKGARIGAVANYDLTNNDISSYAAYYQQRLFNHASFRLNVNWDKYIGSINTFANLQIDLQMLRSITEARFYGSNSLYSENISGTIGFDPHLSEFFFANPTTQTNIGNGAAIIRLFLDANENGVLDNGEQIIPDVRLEVQNASIDRRSSEYGVVIYNLVPYSRYNVYIENESIGNPLWVPKFTEFSIISDPNVYKSVNVPCYAAAVIEGYITRIEGTKRSGQKGVKLHINSSDGTFSKTIPVFNDGSFYLMGVPPGDYELTLDSLQMELIGSYSVPEKLNFTVPRSTEGTFVQGLNIEVHSKILAELKTNEEPRLQTLTDLDSDAKIDDKSIELNDKKNETIEQVYEKRIDYIDPLINKQFNYDKTRDVFPTKQLREYLDKIVYYLNSNKNSSLSIIGHADNFSSMEDTQIISDRRAQAAMKYLTERGIDKSRIFARGEGSRNPIASNLTPEGRKKNRRIEIQIIE